MIPSVKVMRPPISVDAGVTTDVNYQWQVNRVGLWENLDDVSGDYTGSDTDELTVNNPVSSLQRLPLPGDRER